MALTEQQQDIVKAATEHALVKVDAVSGSGKTHTLSAIAEALKPERGLYLAYNKAIATEAKQKFPFYIDCRTVHSLAYQYIIAKSNKTIDSLTPRCIDAPINYGQKLDVLAAIKMFCLSGSLDPDMMRSSFSDTIVQYARQYIQYMAEGKISCTFDFILKYFHLQLHAGSIVPTEYDLLMLDEAGDTSGVILEIFKLLPAKRKVMVGDPQQNIYTFAHTINGFADLIGDGVSLPLSKSFRVNPRIAESVEEFCRNHLDPNMVFEGTEQPDKDSASKAYISRTNSGLIGRCIELNRMGETYTFTRPPKDIFSLVMTIMTLKEDTIVYDRRYAYLPEELREYNNSEQLQREFTSFKGYLAATYGVEDIAIRSAINLLFKYSYKEMFEAYDKAKAMPKEAPIVLTTAHSSKGLEFDSVYIEDDLNKSCERAKLATKITDDVLAELRLYYVACTRARFNLYNAKELFDD